MEQSSKYVRYKICAFLHRGAARCGAPLVRVFKILYDAFLQSFLSNPTTDKKSTSRKFPQRAEFVRISDFGMHEQRALGELWLFHYSTWRSPLCGLALVPVLAHTGQVHCCCTPTSEPVYSDFSVYFGLNEPLILILRIWRNERLKTIE